MASKIAVATSSTFSAAVNLSKLCIGAGILALPHATARGGLVFSPLVIAVVALWNGYACNLMIDCKQICSAQCMVFPDYLSSTYSKIAFAGAGNGGVLLTDFCIIATLLGVCITYQIAFATLLEALPNDSLNRTTLTIAFGLLSYPVSCARNVSKLAVLSLAGLICLVLSVIAILVYGTEFYGAYLLIDPLHSQATGAQLTLWPSSVSDFMSFVGVATFCFGLCSLAFPVEESMRDKSSFGRAVAMSLLFVWGMYTLLGEGGALLYLHDKIGIMGNILANLPADSATAISVRVAMAAVCLLTYPLTLVPPAHMLEHLIMSNWNCDTLPQSISAAEARSSNSSSDSDHLYKTVGAVEMAGSYGAMQLNPPTSAYAAVASSRHRRSSSIEEHAEDVAAGREGLHTDTPLLLRASHRALLVAFTTAFSIFIPCFGLVISLLGGCTVAVLSFVLPSYLHLRIVQQANALRSDATAPPLYQQPDFWCTILGASLSFLATSTVLIDFLQKLRSSDGTACF